VITVIVATPIFRNASVNPVRRESFAPNVEIGQARSSTITTQTTPTKEAQCPST
jgi:hypothetical protein